MDKKKIFSTSQIFFLIISIILSVLIVVYFAQIKRDLELFKKISPYWLIPALVGQACTYFFGALVYTQLIKAFNVHIHNKTWKLFQVSIVTLFLNQTVPSAGLSGNAYFFNFLRKKNVPAHQTVTLISIELLSFYAAMELIILVTVIIGVTLVKLTRLNFIVLGVGFLVYLIFGLGVQFLSKRKTISALLKKMQSVKIFRKLIDKAKKSMQRPLAVKQVDSPLQFFRKHQWAVLRATLLQICLFLADAFTIYALFRGIGVPIAIMKIPVALILTRIIALLPISPGALIIFEGGMTYFFTSLGVQLGPAAIVTIAFRVLSFWLPMVLGFILYKKLQNE